MSKLVTPPDLVNEDIVYLIVNASAADLEMISRYLQIIKDDYTIHLYYDNKPDLDWLGKACQLASQILVNKEQTNDSTVKVLLNHAEKIQWIGRDQEYFTAINYMLKNDRLQQQ
jgi:hypothetical protein